MNQLFPDPASPDVLFGPFDILVVVLLSALCTFVVAKVYQITHRGTSYSQSYIHGLFLMAFCTAIVMMIIGSNIARAFSLVGALSIIRFRTAVKDVRDTAYLFFAIVVGMGCGTGFYLHTLVFTAVTSVFMWVLFRLDYAVKNDTEEILKVTFSRASGAAEAVEAYLRSNVREFRLINSMRNFDKEDDTHVFVVRNLKGQAREQIPEGLSEIEGVSHAELYLNDQQVHL